MKNTRWMTLEERFLNRAKPAANGCWEWSGAISSSGYGCIRVDGKNEGAHRAAFKLFIGNIPKGMEVCHKCDVPTCVNPDHLFVGTSRDNIGDSVNKGRHRNVLCERNLAKTKCKHGHEFTPENTSRDPKGARRCIECQRVRSAKHYWGQKQHLGINDDPIPAQI